MKKIITLLIFVLFLTGACRYEEGPGISLHSPSYRIIGTWQLIHVYLNGEEITKTEYTANVPGNYYYFYSDAILSVATFYNGMTNYSYYGKWKFQNKDKELIIDLSLISKKYYYVATIKKLSRTELCYEYDDAAGNHWRLEMNSRSNG
ncbi:MAG: hypothetical protein RR356_08315 [Bacteroidales bacterium]